MKTTYFTDAKFRGGGGEGGVRVGNGSGGERLLVPANVYGLHCEMGLGEKQQGSYLSNLPSGTLRRTRLSTSF